jgi:TIR domain
MASDDAMDAFLSHSSVNTTEARRVERTLRAAGLKVWFDRSTIRLGFLLRKELQQGIQASRVLVLLWSKAASGSPWVKAELLTAFHRNRFILPCLLDPTPLPQFLRGPVALDLRRTGSSPSRELVRAIREAPRRANELLPLMRAQNAAVGLVANQLWALQQKETDAMGLSDLRKADRFHKQGARVMMPARKKWAFEADLMNLAGYHAKNEYLIKHWDAIQAGQGPRDALLDTAQGLFFDSLLVNPNDVSAINGLGSVLILQYELEAAEFFVERAIKLAAREGLDYSAAQQDLEMIRRYYHKRTSKAD